MILSLILHIQLLEFYYAITARGPSSRAPSSCGSVYGRSVGSRASAEEAYPDGRILEVPNLRIFTFSELRAATQKFKVDYVLGEGGFGRVYKGWVDETTLNPSKSGVGMIVAVKKLNPESMQGLQEWRVRDAFYDQEISSLDFIKLRF